MSKTDCNLFESVIKTFELEDLIGRNIVITNLSGEDFYVVVAADINTGELFLLKGGKSIDQFCQEERTCSGSG